MLLASGLNFGFRRGLPHLWGVALGFGAMVLAVGIGLGSVFQAYPLIYVGLKYAGTLYLLYLAWQIANADGVAAGPLRGGRPLTFLQSAAFQWFNPKGWVMAVGAVSAYAAVAPFPLNMVLIAGLFTGFGVFSSATWLGFGTGLGRLLTNRRTRRVVNIAMALLLLASLWPVLSEAWWDQR
jgi:threonine/homoserine/homoserine lactone efflux protein